MKILLATFLSTIGTVTSEWSREMENSGLFQGDIVLRPDEREGVWKKNHAFASIKEKRWPGAVIPYAIHDNIGPEVRANIPKAIAEYERYTCIRFRRRTSEKAYVMFGPGLGCSSPIGWRRMAKNKISLGSGCKSKGIIMHEIGHTIGLAHEQSRPDRDNYVSIIFSKILQGMSGNFHKMTNSNIDSLGTPYDYLSMMHYGKTAFSRNRKDVTIQTKDRSYQDKIGQRGGFSEIDKKQINLMYCNGGGVVPPKTQTPPTNCVDANTGCGGWANGGYCKTNSAVRRMCCVSCKK